MHSIAEHILFDRLSNIISLGTAATKSVDSLLKYPIILMNILSLFSDSISLVIQIPKLQSGKYSCGNFYSGQVIVDLLTTPLGIFSTSKHQTLMELTWAYV